MGSMYRRGWIWWIKYSKAGTVRCESSKSGLKREAQRLLRMREGDLAKGHPLLPTKKTGQHAFELVQADYDARGLASLEHIERYWALHLKDVFGARSLESIDYAALSDYRSRRMKQKASKATINREVSLVSRMLTLAKRRRWIVDRPLIPKVAEKNARKGFFEPQAYEDVMQQISNRTLRYLLTCAYWTGWRVKSELLTRTWHHIDRARQTIRLEPNETKNGEGRHFPYGKLPQMVYVIDELWKEHEARKAKGIVCPWVFARKSTPERIKSFYKAWHMAARAAGCPWAIPHDFRRTAVRNLVRKGVSEKVAMQLTGHKTRSVFDRYDIVSGADLNDAIERYAEPGQASSSAKRS